MAKISLRVFKKGKPIFWIIGAVVIFVVFYVMFNRGGSSASGGTTVVQSGPSEALQAAALQASTAMGAAQLSASVETARIGAQRDQAAMASQIALAQLGSGERVALETLEYEREASTLNAQTNLLINEQNLSYSLESARVASATQIGLRELDVGMVTKQMETQAGMFKDQLAANAAMFAVQADAMFANTALAQIGSLKKKNRDEALAHLTSTFTGTPNTYVPQRGGGISAGDIAGVLSPLSNIF